MKGYSPFFNATARTLQTLAWFPFHYLVVKVLGITIRGAHHVEGQCDGFILAANHTSKYDVILIATAMPHYRFLPVHYVARGYGNYKGNWLERALFGGVLFRLFGAYPTKSGYRDYSVSLFTHIELLRRGHTVCIFPEGHITRDGTIGQARGGVIFLAEISKKKVIPVHIQGLYRISARALLMRAVRTLMRGQRRATLTPITIEFGAPITVERPVHTSQTIAYDAQAHDLMQHIARMS